MSNQWFRFYNEVLNDPKVQTLPAELFKTWVNLLCIANQHDGNLPSLDAVSFALRATKESVSSAFHELISCGLIDERKGKLSIHGWKKRQFKSDTSTERVKRFRAVTRNSIVTPPEQIQSRADTEQNRTDINTTSNEVVTGLAKKSRRPDPTAPELLDENNFETIPTAALVKLSPASDLPNEWGEYAVKLGWQPDQIMAEWHKLVWCFTEGSKAGTRRSVKGWKRTWASWIDRAARSAA